MTQLHDLLVQDPSPWERVLQLGGAEVLVRVEDKFFFVRFVYIFVKDPIHHTWGRKPCLAG